MKEDKSIFLKVDGVEPVFKTYPSPDVSYIDGIKVWIGGDGHFFPCDEYFICEPDVATEVGRRQAFNLFKKLYDVPPSERRKVFGVMSMADLISKETYDDLAKKLDAWKKEKEEIRVRDEVRHKALNERFVVTKIHTPCNGDVIVNGLKKDGTAIRGILLCDVEKTGVHVDDLDAYLEV